MQLQDNLLKSPRRLDVKWDVMLAPSDNPQQSEPLHTLASLLSKTHPSQRRPPGATGSLRSETMAYSFFTPHFSWLMSGHTLDAQKILIGWIELNPVTEITSCLAPSSGWRRCWETKKSNIRHIWEGACWISVTWRQTYLGGGGCFHSAFISR